MFGDNVLHFKTISIKDLLGEFRYAILNPLCRQTGRAAREIQRLNEVRLGAPAVALKRACPALPQPMDRTSGQRNRVPAPWLRRSGGSLRSSGYHCDACHV